MRLRGLHRMMLASMSSALSRSADATPSLNIVTLRTLLDQRKARGERFRLAEVVSIVVPICTELAERHAKGETVYVHAGSIGAGPDGKPRLIADLARTKPTDPRDAAALAPELASSPTTSRSSVFGIGAVVFEMLTLQPVGPGMKAPTQLVQGLPPIVDTILSKALVTDLTQRPDDLAAFAQAIHHFAPQSVAPPPMTSEAAFEVELDLRSSMLPPPELDIAIAIDTQIPQHTPVRMNVPDDPFGTVVDARVSAPVSDPQRVSANRAHDELSVLKARLEADPAPRWIMVKDKMDHGPFAAIELLQMIASDRFAADDLLVDTHNGHRIPLSQHPEFSRFAHHAGLKRDQVKEQKAVVLAERSEKTAGAFKGTIGVMLVIGVVAVCGVVAWKIKGSHDDAQRDRDTSNVSISGEGSISTAKTAPPKPKWTGGAGGGGYAGTSYDDALKNSVSGNEEEGISMGECAQAGGDIALGCGLSGKATAKFVVQGGRTKGVSVVTDPPQPGVNSCMAARIGSMSWRNMPAATGCIRSYKTQ